MNLGRTVFAQLISFLPDREFRRCVSRYDGDRRWRSFSCWDQFLSMAFAQLTYRESLRDIEACLRSLGAKLYHMGFCSQDRPRWGTGHGNFTPTQRCLDYVLPQRQGSTTALDRDPSGPPRMPLTLCCRSGGRRAARALDRAEPLATNKSSRIIEAERGKREQRRWLPFREKFKRAEPRERTNSCHGGDF